MGERTLVVPPALRRGDIVGIAAPGSAVPAAPLEAGVRVLRGLGLRVLLGESVRARHGTLAGDDTLRGSDLTSMLEDAQVRGIVFARGGWGTSRILDRIPWRRLADDPKLLLGYSDLTSLFAPVLDRCGIACVYGPSAAELGDRRLYHHPSFQRALFHPRKPLVLRVPARSVLAEGRAKGRLAGGCLTLLAHLSGTPYAPRLRDRVLMIEEIGEPPYRLDRLLTQLRLAGSLDGVRAVLVGSLEGCVPRKGAGPSPTAREIIASCFEKAGIPVVAGLPFGHVDAKVSLPLGFRAIVDTARRRIALAP